MIVLIIIYCVVSYVIAGLLIYSGLKKTRMQLQTDNTIAKVIIHGISDRIKAKLFKPSVVIPACFTGLFIIPVIMPFYLIYTLVSTIRKWRKKRKNSVLRIVKNKYSNNTAK